MSKGTHDDFEECPCSGRTLARLLQPAVMVILAREPLHGYLVGQRLAAMAMFRDHPPDQAGVYRVLKSMEDSGFVSSDWEMASGGPPRRRFALTPEGRACLARWTETLRDYRQAITELLRETRRSAPHAPTP